MRLYPCKQLATSLVTVALCAALFSSRAAAQNPSLKVGVISALSGPVADTGNSVRQAIQLADEQKDTKNNVEFIFEDDQFSAKLAVSAAEKLITQEKVSALITFSGTVSLAVSAIAERRGVPMIAITPLTKVSAGKKYVLTIFVPTHIQNQLLSHAMERGKLTRAAVVTTQQDALLGIRDAFLAASGDRVIWQQEIPPGDTSLNAVVTKLLAQKPDVVYALTLPPQTSHLAKLLREQRYNGALIGGPPMSNPSEIKAANGALTGAILPGPQRASALEILRSYTARFGTPCVSEGLYGYDAATLLISLASGPSFHEAFVALNVAEGMSGKYTISPERLIEIPGELLTITGSGDVVPLQ